MADATRPLERGVGGGLAGFRALAWAWMAVVLHVSRADLQRAIPAVALCAAAAALTAALGAAARWRPGLLLHPAVVAGEVGLGAALLAADGWVYGGRHDQSLGSAWPIAGTMAAGVALGPAAGAGAGAVLGLARWGGTHLDDLGSPGLLSLLSTAFLYALAGGAAGVVMQRLRRAEDEIASARAREEAARAREEVARTLHDGVLQTLAAVQRRSPDAELAALARSQERELRQMLFGIDRAPGDLLSELRRAASRAEVRHGLSVEVTSIEEPGPLAADVVLALAAAAGEALTNAATHGGAGRAVVLVDPAPEGLAVSINDDGRGFDPAGTSEGVGLARSIRGRVADVGGTVEVRSTPGTGTEVVLRLAPP